MKAILTIAIVISSVGSSGLFADTHVNGYYRNNGTYVQPHYRSDSNSTKLDNWSTQGNTNPYTGSVGTKNPYGSGTDYSPKTTTNPYSNPYSSPYKSRW